MSYLRKLVKNEFQMLTMGGIIVDKLPESLDEKWYCETTDKFAS